MNQPQLSKIRIYFTGVITLAMLALLSWQFFHDGVPSHHLLQSADYPAVSNWWGALLLPVLTWVLVGRVHNRILLEGRDTSTGYSTNVLVGFCLALLYGAGMSMAFATGYSEISSVMFPGILGIALFFKIYREEYILGFILSMSIVFGAVLPTLFGTIIALASAIVYHSVHYLLNRLKAFTNRAGEVN